MRPGTAPRHRTERNSVRNLCVGYHGVVGVHDASLDLEAGTICARSIGIHTGMLHDPQRFVLSLAVVAMPVTPGATAHRRTDRFDRMAWIAILSALLSSLGGRYWSHWMDASTAGCIVLVQTLLFLIAPHRPD